MKSDIGIQLSPNVSPKKAHRVLVPIAVCGLEGTVSYVILVLMMISDLLFIVSLITGWLRDFPDGVTQDQKDNDGPKHQAGKADAKREKHTGGHYHAHR